MQGALIRTLPTAIAEGLHAVKGRCVLARTGSALSWNAITRQRWIISSVIITKKLMAIVSKLVSIRRAPLAEDKLHDDSSGSQTVFRQRLLAAETIPAVVWLPVRLILAKSGVAFE
jgi:hypothetical protein